MRLPRVLPRRVTWALVNGICHPHPLCVTPLGAAQLRWFEIFLHSNVARRIFGVFIICALLPISALTFISFRQVTEQLERDARLQLRQAAKSEGAAMYERLEFLVDDLGTIASGLRGASEDANPYMLGGVGRDTSQLFQGIAVITPSGDLQTLFGNIETLPGLSDAQIRHLEAGSAVLVTFPCAVNGICPRLLRYVDPSKPSRGLLIGDPQPAYLWDGDKLPPSTKVCVIDENGQPVYCSDAAANEIRAAIAGSSGSAGTLEWASGRIPSWRDTPLFFYAPPCIRRRGPSCSANRGKMSWLRCESFPAPSCR